MPWQLVEMIAKALPEVDYRDAAELIWSLRVIKSSSEIVHLRRSHEIVEKAFADVFPEVIPGMSERDIYQRLAIQMLAHGADRPGHILIASGLGNYARQSGGPTDRRLEVGDMLWVDMGCIVHGYWSDFSRCVVIGRATDSQRDVYRKIRTLTHDALAAIAPGAPVARMAEVAVAGLRELGLEKPLGTRVGHGIGLDLTEPPSVSPADPAIAEPGMVLTIEPGKVTADGIYQLEEVFCVTEDGIELLTRPADIELPVV
jgi:Xaa-Pro aminopeptidase